jgi:hypothetical protein
VQDPGCALDHVAEGVRHERVVALLVEREVVVVCAVPLDHPWAARRSVSRAEFLRTPVVVRDPAANARWTVETVLAAHGLSTPPYLAQAPTPRAAQQEALARRAPVLLSRHVLGEGVFTEVAIEGLEFPRVFELVFPGEGEPSPEVEHLCDRLRAAVAGW